MVRVCVPTVSTEVEEEKEEGISILTVSVNKEVTILQSKPEIAKCPLANVSNRKQTTLDTEESHSVMDETVGETELGSTSDNSGVIERLQKQLQKSERLRFAMKKSHKRRQRQYREKIKTLEQEVRMQKRFSNALKNMFNDDQIKKLRCEYKRMPKWCNSTLVKAYQLKFSCGLSGYKELLKHGFPLPSLRTLNRKLENLKFQSGILHEVFQFLHIKVSQL
ncbi:PREDICTED: uncharacterized protein LOC105556459 [Vollenhovia emeryi]|uniref:uncharacterized protein LOC105556459 n=1 Tax=Vollenhovia emeryi TaxID=411798 RepID=UPI0005F3AD33|nr:PREDICTED: uncharacterized protein LOC105556459 [Vollenhovia emeryi]